MESLVKYATKVEIPASSTSNHYKQWKNKNNLLGTGYSTCYSRSSPLAGKNGTYHTPAPVILTNFGFNVPETADIQKVVIHYKQRKEQLSSPIGQTAYPAVNAPKITLLNSDGLTATGSDVPINYTTYTREFSGTAEFTNVTPAMINSALFGVRFDYPKNANTNPGVVWLGDVYIEIVFNENNIILSIDNSNSEIRVNEGFVLDFNCQYLGNDNTTLKLPLDLDNVIFAGKKTGNGTITKENNIYYWNVAFNGKSTRKISLNLRSETTGDKSITLSYLSLQAVCNFTVLDGFITTVENTLKYVKRIKVGEITEYQIIIKNDSNKTIQDSFKATFPSNVNLVNADTLLRNFGAVMLDIDGTRELVFHVNFKNSVIIPIRVIFPSTGYYTQEISYIVGDPLSSLDFTVFNTSLGSLAFEFIKVPESITGGMGHNYNYVLSCFTRWVTGNEDVYIVDYQDNLRVGVFNSSSSYVTDDEEFLNHVHWSKSLPTHNFKETTVYFKYNSNNPLYLVYSHGYTLETNFVYVGLEYSEPVLIEQAFFGKITDNKTVLSPARNILTGGDYCSGVIPVSEESAPLIVHDLNLGGLAEAVSGEADKLSDIIVQGLEVEFNYTANNQVTIGAELYLPDKRSATRNLTVKGSGTIVLGRKFDIWGLKLGDLQNTLDMLGFYINVINISNNPATVELNDLKIHIYYLVRPDVGKYGFICDGERSRDYGVYLEEVELPFGTEFEKEEYHINGTDENTVVRTNIDSKEIKMNIGIDDCEETDIIYLVDKLETLLTNQRELQTNKPILKSIAFDVMPSWKYRFVRVKEFDGELTNGSYNAKITLFVPSGTRESINKTTTGSNGTTGSFIPIKPIIYCRSNTNGRFTLKEVKNNFVLSIKNNNINAGDTIIVDNQDRLIKVLKQGSNSPITLYEGISLETTWFIIQGEYIFTSETSNVYQVEYYEKR